MRFPPYPDIENLLPHSGRMSLLDAVVDHGADWISTEVVTRGTSVFADDDGVAAWVGLEYMAQSVAAWAGLQAYVEGRPVKLGFLVSTRRYTSRWPVFPLHSRLLTRADRKYDLDGELSVFDCRITCSDEAVADATLSVFQPADPRAILKGGPA